MISKSLSLTTVALMALPIFAADPLPEDELYLDFNGDGTDDLWYEWSDLTYLQLTDRNYDGEPDEIYQFDARTNWLLSGRLDENFDGHFETRIVMQNNMQTHGFVDSDKDGFVDIVYNFVHDVPTSGRKFDPAGANGTPEIITFNIEYGITVDEHRAETSLTANEFHTDVVSKVRLTQEMPR